MPNKNYLTGRRFEYEVMKSYEDMGLKVMRTAGSHGEFDVIAYGIEEGVYLIQCKVVETEKAGRKLADKWLEETEPSTFYEQVLEVKVRGRKLPLTFTV